MSFVKRRVVSESSATRGIFGFWRGDSGSLWRREDEEYRCDVCDERRERLVMYGVYTGIDKMPLMGFRSVSVGYKGHRFDFCEDHSEKEIKESVEMFLSDK